MGPSLFLNLPNKIWLIIIGNSLNAFFGAFLIVPVVNEIIDRVALDFKENLTSKLKE